MRVIATAEGFDNVTVRKVGDEFDMPEGSTAPWFKKAEDDTKGPKAKKDKSADKVEGDPIA